MKRVIRENQYYLIDLFDIEHAVERCLGRHVNASEMGVKSL